MNTGGKSGNEPDRVVAGARREAALREQDYRAKALETIRGFAGDARVNSLGRIRESSAPGVRRARDLAGGGVSGRVERARRPAAETLRSGAGGAPTGTR